MSAAHPRKHARVRIIGAASGLGAQDQACADGPVAVHRSQAWHELAHHPRVDWGRTLFAPAADGGGATGRLAGLCRHLADEVGHALRGGEFPVIIGGDHSVAIGTWSGVARVAGEPVGLLWIDAHLDSHTPETSYSGAIHGMPLACLLGRGDKRSDSPADAVKAAYPAEPRGDEFMPPMIFDLADQARIRDDDVILWFNFRADRARQLSEAFLKADFDGFDREVTPKTGYYTLTEYDQTYAELGCQVVFGSSSMSNILGEVIANAGLKQLRSAETEKYPHVTFFFNGGRETPFEGEDRYLAISPKEVPTYDKKPQMSAPDVAFEVYRRLPEYDAVIMNFANPDMVGHTGVVEAGIHACETIDVGVQLIVDRVLALGGKCLITADHGNCEQMRNADGSPHTAHTTNLVHLIYVAADKDEVKLQDGILADIAPTLLDMLGVAQPAEMTGKSLIVRAA